MKKILLFMLPALMASPAIARDFSFEYEGQTVTYTVLNEEAKTCKTKEGYMDSWGAVTAGNKDQAAAPLVIPAEATDNGNAYTVVEIGDYSFSYTNATGISIPETVTRIGMCAFIADNSSLKYADFASVESLCNMSFADRTANPLNYAGNLYIGGKEVSSIDVPEGATEIRNNTFAGCSSLKSITLPESITRIGDAAFINCSGLESIDIPNSVTEMGWQAFCFCSGLKSVNLSKSLTAIPMQAFMFCSSLEEVTIPEGVTKVDYAAFGNCSGLKSLTIPASITEFGYQPFDGCSGLRSVYYSATEPVAFSDIFPGVAYMLGTLYVPEEAVELAKTTAPWSNFDKIEAYNFTNGVDAVAADFDKNAPCEVYTIGGVKVSESLDGLKAGIYVVRQGDKAKKISVK